MKRRIREILNRPYARILIRDDDGTYTAEILEFPGCYAEGETAEEAVKDLEQAAASWIEAAIEQKQEIPEPLDTYGYSGRINLRLPKSIHKQAVRFAQKEGVSLNQYFTGAIAARIGAEELYDRLVERLEGRITATAYTFQFQQVMGIGVSFPGVTAPIQFPGVTVTNSTPVVTAADEQKAIANG